MIIAAKVLLVLLGTGSAMAAEEYRSNGRYKTALVAMGISITSGLVAAFL